VLSIALAKKWLASMVRYGYIPGAMIPVAARLLRVWRKRAGKTQGQAADLLQVRQATWSEYESGRKTPRTTGALKLAEITEGAVPIEQWGQFESDGDHERDLALGESAPAEEEPPAESARTPSGANEGAA
jgi:transcriptional regulator with XRE-family HTH domain